jgi:hypothetical protein
VKHEHLSELQFTQLTQELICRATADGTLASDALAALAKALGTLIAFTARREGLANDEVLSASQNAVADYATAARIFICECAAIDPLTRPLLQEKQNELGIDDPTDNCNFLFG